MFNLSTNLKLSTMKFRSIIWLIFLLVTLVELLTQIYGWGGLHTFIKPLLMPILGIALYLNVEKKTKYLYLLILALLMSWLGDVFLLFADISTLYFMLGLISFLFAHIFYVYIFTKTSDKYQPLLFTYATGFSLLLYGFLLTLYLWAGLGEMKLPVIIYMTVIMFMGLSALFRKSIGASLVLVGAILFITSDSLLAVNKFHKPIAVAGFWVMLTYILAQYFIVSGMIKSLTSSSK